MTKSIYYFSDVVIDALDFALAQHILNDSNTLAGLRDEARRCLNRLNKTRTIAKPCLVWRLASVRARRSPSSLRRSTSDSGGDGDTEPEPKRSQFRLSSVSGGAV